MQSFFESERVHGVCKLSGTPVPLRMIQYPQTLADLPGPLCALETEIDQLIASCNKKTAAFLQFLKETGMRRGEAWNLNGLTLIFKNKTVRVTPEKGSNPRVLKISSKLVAMLKLLPQQTPEPFNGSLIHFQKCP